MPCYGTITGWQAPAGGPLKFGAQPSPAWKRLQVPCGQCIGCRKEHSRQWAMRCVLESRTHPFNTFVTLTYDDKHLPENYSLDKSHLRKFFDRLRKKKWPYRYYACGEYGDITQRAHYHACLFGMDFDDKKQFKKVGDHTLYISEELNRLWGMGHTSIGELNFDTAAYTARYVMKKAKGSSMGYRYARLDEETGELIPLVQPYAVMSLASAIAKQWLTRHHNDIYGHDKDYLVIRGRKMKPPKYFDKLYDTINPTHLAQIKETRQKEKTDYTIQELRTHEIRARAKIIQRKEI